MRFIDEFRVNNDCFSGENVKEVSLSYPCGYVSSRFVNTPTPFENVGIDDSIKAVFSEGAGKETKSISEAIKEEKGIIFPLPNILEILNSVSPRAKMSHAKIPDSFKKLKNWEVFRDTDEEKKERVCVRNDTIGISLPWSELLVIIRNPVICKAVK